VGAVAGDRPQRDTDVWGTDLYLKFRPISGGTDGSHTVVSLQAEALYRRRQVPDAVLADVSGYAQVLWRFAQRWGVAGRYEYGSAADSVVGDADDALDPEWTRGRHRVSGNVTFWPTEFSRLRAQLSVDDPRWMPDPIVAAFVAVELAVGAHGAHAF
jgi:hypothetical protein